VLAMGALAFAMHALLVSPPAQALTSDESNFVAAVEADGVSGIDAQTMVDNGYRICNDLNTGLTPAQASDQTTVLNPSVSLVQSFGMTENAQWYLCPSTLQRYGINHPPPANSPAASQNYVH